MKYFLDVKRIDGKVTGYSYGEITKPCPCCGGGGDRKHHQEIFNDYKLLAKRLKQIEEEYRDAYNRLAKE